jgi:hypothetical protein
MSRKNPTDAPRAAKNEVKAQNIPQFVKLPIS